MRKMALIAAGCLLTACMQDKVPFREVLVNSEVDAVPHRLLDKPYVEDVTLTSVEKY